jgi:hypothetical protein
MARRTIVGCYGIVGLSLIALDSIASPAFADPALKRMACASLIVEDVSAYSTQKGVTRASLQNGLLVRVKSRLPRLEIADDCGNAIYLKFSAQEIETSDSRSLGYYGDLRIEVLRLATITETAERRLVTVWVQSVTFVGPQSPDISGHLFGVLDRLLDRLSAEYYQAENE